MPVSCNQVLAGNVEVGTFDKSMSLLWELPALCLQVSAHLDRRTAGEKAIVGYLKYIRNQLLFVMPTG